MRFNDDDAAIDATKCDKIRFLSADAQAAQALAGPTDGAKNAAGLTVQQSHAVTLLASGYSIDVAASRVGVSRSTVFRWRQLHPAFGRELRRRTHIEHAELAARARGLIARATRRAELALDGDGDSSAWAARVLRNPKLWALAAEADDDGADASEPT